MSCNCNHNRQEITEGKKIISEFRELFIKRMTVDSDTMTEERKTTTKPYFASTQKMENTSKFFVGQRWKWFYNVLTMRSRIGEELFVM